MIPTNDKDQPTAAGFCTLCGVSIASFDGLSQCTNCGTKGIPCSNADNVSVRINWHELSILTIWAERWAVHHQKEDASMRGLIYAITDRIAEQFPDYADRPLTLAGQLGQVRDAYPGAQTTFPGVEGMSIDPPDDGMTQTGETE